MKRIKLYIEIGILIILFFICILFLYFTTCSLYTKKLEDAGVYVTVLGFVFTIVMLYLPYIRKRCKKNIFIERVSSDDHFVDRNIEYTKLINLIKQNPNGIIYITGCVGMGKTSFIKMACDRVNYLDKNNWKSYAAFYFKTSYAKTIPQEISEKFCNLPYSSIKDISKCLHYSTLKEKIILVIDNISRTNYNECVEFAKAFIKCNKNNYIIITIDSNEELGISPSKFLGQEIQLLANSYNIKMEPSEINSISELSNGYPVYARYSVEAYTKGIKIAEYNSLENYIERIIGLLSEKDKVALSLIICLNQLLQNGIEINTLYGIDNSIVSQTIKNLRIYSLIDIHNKKIFIDELIALKCLDFLSEYKNDCYKKIYNYYQNIPKFSYIALVAALKSDFKYDNSMLSRILHNQYLECNFYILVLIGEMELTNQINPYLRNDKNSWIYIRFYYLKSLLELGLYNRAKEAVDSYDNQFNLLNIDNQIDFEYQYLLTDLEHLTNYFENAIAFSEILLLKASNKLQAVKCKYLIAHCLRHIGENLDQSYSIFCNLIKDIEYKDDKIRIRSMYSAASIKMFQGEKKYPYEKVFEEIEQLICREEKNAMWRPYVARHRAIYLYKFCNQIDDAEQVLLDMIKRLEVTPLRIKYDIYFELAELNRMKDITMSNYNNSYNYYIEALEFAQRVHDYNLESSAQLGVMLLNFKYDNNVNLYELKQIISKTKEIKLNINYNCALYVNYVINNQQIPSDLLSYWEIMQYSDLLLFSSKSKSEKSNLKLTVM